MLAICANDTVFWAKDESVRCCVALVWYKPYNSVFTAMFCYYLYENVFENFIHCVCQSIRFQQNNVHIKSSSWTEKQLFYTTEFFMTGRFLCFPGVGIL